MDLTSAVVPRSDQLNGDDLLAGPRTVTITEVKPGSAEQPVHVHLAEFPGRPWKPCKTMIRLLIHAWEKESSVYSGRRLTLYRDPTVKYGGTELGGIRISHMSDIDGPLAPRLTTTRGRNAKFPVEPLVEAAPDPSPRGLEPSAAEVAASTNLDELGAMWKLSGPERRAQIEARVFELKESQLPQSGADVDPNGASA